MKFLVASAVMSNAAAADCSGTDTAKLAECMKGAPVVTYPMDNSKMCDFIKWTLWCSVHSSGDYTISSAQTEACKTVVSAMQIAMPLATAA